MRRMISFIVALVLCVSLCGTVFADDFVPSITEKGAPEIITIKDAEGNDAIGQILDEDGNVIGYLYEECLLITPVSQAKTSEKIPDHAEDLLLDVYQKLLAGTMQLPYDKLNANLDPAKMVIKDLFDVTWLCGENADENFDEEHPDHEDLIAPKGVTVKITFDLAVGKNAGVYCMSYKNNTWNPVVKCVNNGDGTVTCTFEDFCPVAFSVGSANVTPPSQTGDPANPALWIVLMSVSVVALGAVLVLSRRKAVR